MNDDKTNLPLRDEVTLKEGCTCKLQSSPRGGSKQEAQIERDPGCPVHGELAEVKRKGG